MLLNKIRLFVLILFSEKKIFFLGFTLILIRILPFFFGFTPIIGDNLSLMVPGKIFTAHWLRRGVIPLWNPHIMAGIPWLGDINQSVLHPSSLVFMMFSPGKALNIVIGIFLLVTFIGAYHLGRSLKLKMSFAVIASLIWSFSPQVIGYIGNISLLQTASLFPWVLWATIRLRRHPNQWWILTVITIFQILGGYPQYVVYSLIASFIISLLLEEKIRPTSIWRKVAQPMFLSVLVAMGFTAPVWMPFLQTVNNSTRVLQSFSQATAGKTHISELLKILIPNLLNNAAVGYKWGPLWSRSPNIVPYVGWFGWFAIGLGLLKLKNWTKVEKILLGFSVVPLGLTFFPRFTTHLIGLIPMLQHSRGLNNLLMVSALFFSLLVAQILQNTDFKRSVGKKLLLSIGVLVFLVTILFVVLIFDFASVWHWFDILLDNKLSNSIFHTLEKDRIIVLSVLVDMLIAGLSLFFSLVFARKKVWIFVLIFIACDIGWQTRSLLMFGPTSVYGAAKESKLSQNIETNMDTRQFRILTQNYNYPYTGFDAYFDALTVRKPFSDSYVTKDELNKFKLASRLVRGLTPDWNMTTNISCINGYTTLVPISISSDFTKNGESSMINNLPELKLNDYNLRKWSVGYYLVDTWFPYQQENGQLGVVWSDEWWRLQRIPGVWSRFRSEVIQPYDLIDYQQTPNRLTVSFDNQHNNSYLIIADRYDPGWVARVNGAFIPIINSHGLRKIPIESDHNTVELSYFPHSLYWGIVAAILTSIGVGVWCYNPNSSCRNKRRPLG